MATVARHEADRSPKKRPRRDSRPRKALTIGAVAKILSQEFDDISISKIRYLEDQKLLAPRRTPGRLPPLLASRRRAPPGDPAHAARRVPAPPGDPPGARDRDLRRRPPPGRRRRAEAARPHCRLAGPDDEPGGACRAGRRLRSSSCASSASSASSSPSASTGARASTRPTSRSSALPPSLPSTGSPARNLRVFRTSADREAALLEQLLGASLRSRSPARGARPSRTSRTSPPSAATSSSFFWSATFAASRATSPDPPRGGP